MNTSNPMFSFIVPIFNKEKYLSASIESLINQTEQDFEIICIDDASTDESVNIVSKYAEQDGRVKLLKNIENKGVSESRNLGINYAKGRWLLFVDADDRLSPNTLQILKDKIETNSQCDVFLFNGYFVDIQGRPQWDFYSKKVIPSIPEYQSFKVCDYKFILHYVNAALVCVRSDYLRINKVYFTPNMRHEDWDFMWKLFATDPNIIYLPDKLYFYVIAPDGYTVSPDTAYDSLDLFRAFNNGKNYLHTMNHKYKLDFYTYLVALRHLWDFMVIKIARNRDTSLKKQFMIQFHKFLSEIPRDQFNDLCVSPFLLANSKTLIKIRKRSSIFLLLLVLNSISENMVCYKNEVKSRLKFWICPFVSIIRWIVQPVKIFYIIWLYFFNQMKLILKLMADIRNVMIL